jgi:hypothetical protein
MDYCMNDDDDDDFYDIDSVPPGDEGFDISYAGGEYNDIARVLSEDCGR